MSQEQAVPMGRLVAVMQQGSWLTVCLNLNKSYSVGVRKEDARLNFKFFKQYSLIVLE
jgi:hypothetical protein